MIALRPILRGAIVNHLLSRALARHLSGIRLGKRMGCCESPREADHRRFDIAESAGPILLCQQSAAWPALLAKAKRHVGLSRSNRTRRPTL